MGFYRILSREKESIPAIVESSYREEQDRDENFESLRIELQELIIFNNVNEFETKDRVYFKDYFQ